MARLRIMSTENSMSSMKNHQNKSIKRSLSENKLDWKPTLYIDNLVFKNMSSLKTEKNNSLPNKDRSKTIIDLYSFKLNDTEDYNLINQKVNNVKTAVSQYITQLEQRGPKLEELQASCIKLSEHTKDLEQVAVKTKKFYYNNFFHKKHKLIAIIILIFLLVFTLIILKILKS